MAFLGVPQRTPIDEKKPNISPLLILQQPMSMTLETRGNMKCCLKEVSQPKQVKSILYALLVKELVLLKMLVVFLAMNAF